MPKYEERELTEEVRECNERGFLNPEAIGWSRHPLHICNLNARWPRKKKWNFWLITSPRCAFCIAKANVDYLGLAFGFLLDFDTLKLYEKQHVTPFAMGGFAMPERVQDEITFQSSGMKMRFAYRDGGLDITASVRNFGGSPLEAELAVSHPPEHETLNVIIPWSEKEFQFTSKQNTLPTAGFVKHGDRTYEFNPEDSFACLDYGRGVWPYRTSWNWASGSGRIGGDLIGLQFGAKWTDGTGYNENGVCINGKLHKISEDMVIGYDRGDWMKPWTLRTGVTDTVDLTITPFFEKPSKFNAGILSTEVHQVFGHFKGTLRLDGREIKVENIIGWSEEHIGKW